MKNEHDREQDQDQHGRDANRDPITGKPGSHPIGTGVGGVAGAAAGMAGGAAAGAATGTALGGPVGAAVGGVIGTIAGAAGGKAIAEKIDPTREDAYWQEHYTREPYYRSEFGWNDYQRAYSTGYNGYARHASSGRRFEDVEEQLRRDYETSARGSRLAWEHARPAARAAWSRFERDLSQYIDFDVVDANDAHIGKLKCIWSDETGQPAFVGVQTGWLFGKTHVVPAESVHVSEQSRRIRLPYSEQKVKDAPAYDPEAEISEQRENEIYGYYGLSTQPGSAQQRRQSQANPSSKPRVAEREQTEIPLSQEHVKVGKREVEAGGVRLRKIIRTETVNQPVELQREEIVIERIPAGETSAVHGQAFQDQDVYIPLRREEAVVEKETKVREVVRATKKRKTDHQDVSERVRSEDVEVEKTGEVKASRPKTPAEEIAQRGEVPRSQRRRQD